jgi:hypothetical protein
MRNIILIYLMLETSGICMLKIVEYESMSGEHV